MTTPGDPQKGKAAEAEQAEQAAKESTEAVAQEQAAEAAEAAPKPKRARKKAEPEAAQAEGTAAEATGVDKAGAEAAAVSEPEGEPAAPAPEADADAEAPAAEDKPKRTRSRSRKAAEPEKAAETKPATRRRDQPRSGERVIVRAQARYVRSSARKARLVCDGIRGKSVADARAILAFSPRNVAEAWTKLLESAVANAENNHDLVGEELKIHAVYADEGPTIKRYRPRAMGRATRIRKRTSHLTIQLTPKD